MILSLITLIAIIAILVLQFIEERQVDKLKREINRLRVVTEAHSSRLDRMNAASDDRYRTVQTLAETLGLEMAVNPERCRIQNPSPYFIWVKKSKAKKA